MPFNVDQASAVCAVVRYLGGTTSAAGHRVDADMAADALALLAEAAYARLCAGPRAVDAREAIGRLAGQLAVVVGLQEHWAALYPDGTWTSGEDASRAEAEEIITANVEAVLAVRWESRWRVVRPEARHDEPGVPTTTNQAEKQEDPQVNTRRTGGDDDG